MPGILLKFVEASQKGSGGGSVLRNIRMVQCQNIFDNMIE